MMAIRGYRRQPATLAYRTPERRERAYAIARAAEEGIATNDLLDLTKRSNEFLAQWQERAIDHLESTLADLALFSEGQLEVFTTIFRDAGIQVDIGDVPQPSGDFVWGPTARASVLALTDVLADGPEVSLSPASWTEECLSRLDTSRFTGATGVDPGDESVVLRVAAMSFFGTRQGSELLLYRDRLLQASWNARKVQVTYPDPADAFPAMKDLVVEQV